MTIARTQLYKTSCPGKPFCGGDATAIAVNLFTIHLLGDAFSPTLVGYISDRSSLQTGFLAAVVAVAIASGVLYYGKRFAPAIKIGEEQPAGAMP